MSELLVLTDSSMKMCEGNSTKKASKLRFTFPTIQSLHNNIESDKLKKAIEKLNTVYTELISAVEISEKIKAEEEAKNKMLGIAELDTKLEEEKKISKITEVEEVNKRLKNVSIELLKLAGRIGKYKDQFGINVQKGFAQKPPRAISVKKLYTSIYSELMNKIDLYKIAAKDGMEFPQETEKKEPPKKESDGIPNWKKLFEGNSLPENNTVVVNKIEEKEEDESETIVASSGMISEEDLDYRKMVGQLGDELELISNYEKNPESVPTQLREGITQRANKLRMMLSNLTGIETKAVSVEEYSALNNTDFQNLIDKVTGYVAPPTKEEHMKTEESLKEYYNDDRVTSKIRELAEKDVLYTFNQGMDQIIATETKQNGQEAVESIDRSNNEIAAINEKNQERALTESISSELVKEDAIKTLNGYVEMNNKIEQEQLNRMQDLKRSAYIIARKLAARNTAIGLNERNNIVDSSNIEARRLAALNTAIDLHNLYQLADSSNTEARRLAALNTAIDLNELNQIAESAYFEAKRLAGQNKTIEAEKMNEIINSSYEEAIRLAALNTAIDLNASNQIKESAQVEALKLAAKNTAIELNEINQILEASYTEAIRLAAKNTAIDIEEQNKIAQTASQFAVILASENVKQELLQKRDELSKELSSIDSSIDEINKKIEAYNSEASIPNNQIEVKQEVKPEEKSIIIPMEEIKASANEEAQRIFKNDRVEVTRIEQPKNVINVNKNVEVKESKPQLQLENVTFLPISNKYGEQTSNPKPIIASIARADNMQKNGRAILGESNQLESNYADENIDYLNDLNEYLDSIINHNESETSSDTTQEGTTSQLVQNVENPTYNYEAA